MFLELLLFAFLGILLGIVTGITPGVHVNTISFILLGFAYVLSPYCLAVMIIAMAISHTIWNFLPSILLGLPEPSTALSVLPGHRLLLEGRGYEAIYLTVVGGVGAIFLTLLLSPLMLIAIPFLYENIHSYIHWILIAIAFVMILTEKGPRKKLYATGIFLMAGLLGLILLDSYMIPSNFLLFPVFTGLFGLSNLIISLNRKTKIPEQEMHTPSIPRRSALSGILKGIFSGALVGTLPGVGASQATVLTEQITKKRDEREFLISMGAINTIVALFSLISLYTITKARSGAAIAVERILPTFGFTELILLLAVALFATGISALLILKSIRKAICLMEKIDYTKLTILVIVLLMILTAIFTGPLGLFILFVSTSVGLLPPLFGVKRSTSMAVLMLPLIVFYMSI